VHKEEETVTHPPVVSVAVPTHVKGSKRPCVAVIVPGVVMFAPATVPDVVMFCVVDHAF